MSFSQISYSPPRSLPRSLCRSQDSAPQLMSPVSISVAEDWLAEDYPLNQPEAVSKVIRIMREYWGKRTKGFDELLYRIAKSWASNDFIHCLDDNDIMYKPALVNSGFLVKHNGSCWTVTYDKTK